MGVAESAAAVALSGETDTQLTNPPKGKIKGGSVTGGGRERERDYNNPPFLSAGQGEGRPPKMPPAGS